MSTFAASSVLATKTERMTLKKKKKYTDWEDRRNNGNKILEDKSPTPQWGKPRVNLAYTAALEGSVMSDMLLTWMLCYKKHHEENWKNMNGDGFWFWLITYEQKRCM